MIVRQAKHSHETWYVISTSETSFGPVDNQYSVHFKIHPLLGFRIWTCNCPDFTERKQWQGETCKHIDEVQYARSTDPAMTPTPYEQGKAKYGRPNWLQEYHNRSVGTKLETVLESVQALLQEIRS